MTWSGLCSQGASAWRLPWRDQGILPAARAAQTGGDAPSEALGGLSPHQLKKCSSKYGEEHKFSRGTHPRHQRTPVQRPCTSVRRARHPLALPGPSGLRGPGALSDAGGAAAKPRAAGYATAGRGQPPRKRGTGLSSAPLATRRGAAKRREALRSQLLPSLTSLQRPGGLLLGC